MGFLKKESYGHWLFSKLEIIEQSRIDTFVFDIGSFVITKVIVIPTIGGI